MAPMALCISGRTKSGLWRGQIPISDEKTPPESRLQRPDLDSGQMFLNLGRRRFGQSIWTMLGGFVADKIRPFGEMSGVLLNHHGENPEKFAVLSEQGISRSYM